MRNYNIKMTIITAGLPVNAKTTLQQSEIAI